jgi:polar amino acid transport system substrate-binding protein
MHEDVVSELAPGGTLRAAINMANMLLVTGKTEAGGPIGVAADFAGAIAGRLGVALAYVPFATPGELADAADDDTWDIGLIGAEPARAERIAFSPAYVEIESTYLVPAGSPLNAIADVDKAGVTIAVAARSAYELYLTRTLQHAELIKVSGLGGALEAFTNDGLDALAGLRPALLDNLATLPGARILEGRFATVQQAVGTPRNNTAAAAFLRDFVLEARQSGLVAELLERHGVTEKLLVASGE